ncbi:Class I peptide chain release factor [Chitinophaga pinensis DSM 2588]|uniref:Class I peptide chain release factor n=1 Tax=Chitinophaga pinensis (strain ATCC 43595 / DSM 2588 / LMG 13176 / NBRC 15968 / NCIMB 11800 / UQM 2034) TaxID=485918 RepID=A0A979FZC4_CHIPD|nr:alternative ribosome rescue aminoacyl-tRNA hydrolase ArfB [Chitinophaga pinensis]ACU57914.1 Class I peptide chain release factor [Chitinophaga pinensis DSM 2588]
MSLDLSAEITFQTARSGGKGGQNVNKVETMVEGYFDVSASTLLTQEQKALVQEKLGHRINAEGLLQVRSQEERTQLGNKQLVIKKMNELVSKALIKPKKRVPTRPSRAVREKRIQLKKQQSEKKQQRRKGLE